MPSHTQREKTSTTHFGELSAEGMPQRGTRPLDRVLPQALVLRIIGSTNTVRLPVREFTILGRHDRPGVDQADVDLTLYGAPELGVSRQHMVIIMREDGVSVKDLKSTNGTFLNGYSLNPLQTYRLRHGDRLSLGRLILQVLFDDGAR